jgi:GNAT superfamily N-acetyltransferase
MLACTETGEPVGFASLDVADGRPYLDQLSVRRAWRRQGIGRTLIEHALAWSAGAGELWLTTYDARVPWNQPMYERHGFVRVDETNCGPDLQARLADERAVLPAPEGRVAMVYRHRPLNLQV